MRYTRLKSAIILILGVALMSSTISVQSVQPLQSGGTPYQWNLPPGFPTPRVPADNPITQEKVALGRYLFYDTRLSINGTYSCATCHQQERAFTDGRVVGIGATGEVLPRNSMSLANVAYSPVLTWANPNVRSLERQALIPMFNETPIELGLTGIEGEVLNQLRADPRYQQLFRAAFPADADPFTLTSITKAIASFQRTLISGRAPYDRYRNGDQSAVSESVKRGEALFFSERLECFHCHAGFTFTSAVDFVGLFSREIGYHNTGLYNIGGTGAYPPDNTGLFEFSGKPEDMGKFKAPTLRNIELTAPYMHDGSIQTLDEALDHYAAGGRTIHAGPYAGVGSENPYKSGFVRGFELTPEERADVLNFLNSLTDRDFVQDPRFSDPWKNQMTPPRGR
jgi:cytochrome c peroxidase